MKRILVQASSTSWQGSEDLCMKHVEGKPVVWHTISKLRAAFPFVEIVVVAPEFDNSGALNNVLAEFIDLGVSVQYSFDDNPLARMCHACEDLLEGDYVIRIDGLHACFDRNFVQEVGRSASSNRLDICKAPDEFPVQFLCECYRVGALRDALDLLNDQPKDVRDIHIKHARFWMMRQSCFCNGYVEPRYDTNYLRESRKWLRPVYDCGRLEVDDKRKISTGCQLTYHYELALKYVNSDSMVLDVACGDGYGSAIIAKSASSVIGGDLDGDVVRLATIKHTSVANLRFEQMDVLNIPFQDGIFDVVASFETIEHIEDVDRYLNEICRVLVPGGVLVLSTPQNVWGDIPLVYGHTKEYSVAELQNVIGRYFRILDVVGIKGGRVVMPGDPKGSNSFLAAVKR